MKLWLVERADFVRSDQYRSIVVAAKTEEDAIRFEPNDSKLSGMYVSDGKLFGKVENRKVTYLGEAAEGISGLILDDFNAG